MRISPQIAGLYIRYRRDASTTHESYLASLLDGQRYRSVAQPDAIVSVSLGLNYHDYPIPMHHRFVGHHFPHLSQDTRDHVLSLAAASQEPVAQQPTYEWPEDLFESEDEDPASRLLSAREAAREVVREERNSRQDRCCKLCHDAVGRRISSEENRGGSSGGNGGGRSCGLAGCSCSCSRRARTVVSRYRFRPA